MERYRNSTGNLAGNQLHIRSDPKPKYTVMKQAALFHPKPPPKFVKKLSNPDLRQNTKSFRNIIDPREVRKYNLDEK
jgi:hypothetical protein